jgi:hypothetical protein
MKTHTLSRHRAAALAGRLVPALAAGLLTGCAQPRIVIPLEESEAEIGQADVPQAALATLRELAGGAPFTSFEREVRDGRMYYEAEWMLGGREAEATVLADGTLVETERDISLDEAPPAVRAWIEANAAEGEEVTVSRRSFLVYEVDLVSETGERERLLLPSGASATDGGGAME